MTVPVVVKGKRMDFGAGVVHDQERCVLCARCVRFTRLVTKTGELGIVNRTDQARVEIFPGRPLSNRYALNVVDLCPVGAMTSKDFRFHQRVWFLTPSKGICHGCSMGCNIFIDHNCEKYKDDMIYRFRPRVNLDVNGYFICDEGRMTYHAENENRLITARVEERPCSPEEAMAAAVKMLSSRSLLLVSPNCTLEQMLAIKALAEKSGARLSGFSDGYIKGGDGDGWLIQDDKSANRAGLELLGINSSKDAFASALNDADALISFNNDLFMDDAGREFEGRLSKIKVVAFSCHDNAFVKKASVAIPVASYSETEGSVVNKDNILQHFAKAMAKNTPAAEMIEIAARLGGPIGTGNVADEMKRLFPALANGIPEGGLKLTESEASHVAA